MSLNSNEQRASFTRRSIASIIDVILACTILLIGYAIGYILIIFLIDSELTTKASTFKEFISMPIYAFLFYSWLILFVTGFYVYFWCYNGQTLGMNLCRIQIKSLDNKQISVSNALIRLAFSLCGLGNLLILFNKNKQSLQDIIANTEVIHIIQKDNLLKDWHGL